VNATRRTHGGPDEQGVACWDFSTCANAAGPCPAALQAVREADPTRYPDPASRALRERLAALHGVAAQRIVIAASASEFIQRLTAVGARLMPGAVVVPRHGYGDYAAAATACGRVCLADREPGAATTLRWCAEPSSPLGEDAAPPAAPASIPTALDAVYAPLRLHGAGLWRDADRDAVFVMHSPNKALGLCGVRGAYAVAPARASWDVEAWCRALDAAAPSWPLSAQGVAMLDAWCTREVRHWVQESHATLHAWKRALAQALAARGFEVRDSVVPFFCTRPPRPLPASDLRAHGVAVRDAASFGWPGWWRVSAQPPAAIAALVQAWDALSRRAES
jgi:histidinol-phosphate aminotransferase